MPMLAHANLDNVEGMHFTTDTASGHKVEMDSAEAVGGTNLAARPKELIYVSLAGCTGMDAISVLRKMRQPVTAFSVDVEGLEQTEDHPKYWTHIRVIFQVKGDVDPDKLKKSINLSRTRYCGVSASLRDSVKIDYRYVLNGEAVDLGDPERE
ncbi:MAG: OsmC family protein [bacterium]